MDAAGFIRAEQLEGVDNMGGSFSSWGALESALQAELESAMGQTESLCYLDAVQNTSDYRQVQPKVYVVTGQLENSARSTGVSGGGNRYTFDIYDDMAFNYDTGTWSTPKVFNVAEAGGLINPGGFWAKTEEDIQKNIDAVFGAHFG